MSFTHYYAAPEQSISEHKDERTDMESTYKYLLDLVHYSKGDVKAEARELSEQIKMRMDMGVTEIPDELIQKAEIIVHHVSLGFRKRGSFEIPCFE